MNLEEAKEKLELTKEEIRAIQRYRVFHHTAINLLSDFSPENYKKVKAAGWRIPENIDEIKEYIQDYVNLYSAIYKKSIKSHGEKKLYRGTSSADLESLRKAKISSQFLSTSKEKEDAGHFVKEDSAMAYVTVESDVPILDMEEFLDEGEKGENEIIIAPFCKTEVVQSGKTREGFDRYDLVVQKQELREKNEQEIEKLYEEVLKNYSQNLDDIYQMSILKNRFETHYYDRLYKEYEGNAREQKDIMELKANKQLEYNAIFSRTQKFRDNLRDLLEGMCKQKELEINQTRSTGEQLEISEKIEKENEKKRQEEEKAKIQKNEMITEVSDTIYGIVMRCDRLPTKLDEYYASIEESDKKLEYYSQKFGYKSKSGEKNTQIKQEIIELQKKCVLIKEKVESIKIDGNMSLEDLQNILQEIKKYANTLRDCDISFEIDTSHTKYDKMVNDEIKNGIQDKIQQVMTQAKIDKYLKEKKEIQEEKIGFLGKITGKEKEREEKIKNIDLKISMLKIPQEQETGEKNIKDMLVDMHVFAINELNGEFSNEMKELYTKIAEELKTGQKYSEEEIKTIAVQKAEKIRKSKENLPVVQKNKTIFFLRARKHSEELARENAELQKHFLQRRAKKSISMDFKNPKADILSPIEEKLIKTNERLEIGDYYNRTIEETMEL